MRNILSLFLAFFLVACSSSPEQSTSDRALDSDPIETSEPAPGVTAEPAVTGDADIQLTGLSNFPDAVDGCSCALNLDAALEEDDGSVYLFVYNFDNGPGVIGINGAEVELPWIKNEREIPDQDRETYLHENNRYRVETSLMDEGPATDEGRIYSGTVKIVVKQTGKYLLARVVGSCSC